MPRFFRDRVGLVKLNLFVMSAIVMALFCFAAAPSAFASETQFYLDYAPTTPPNNAVLVTVTLTGTVATVEFDAEKVGTTQYYLGNSFIKINGAYTVASVTGSTAGTYTFTANGGSIDSFGPFTGEITDAPNVPSTSIIITLDGTGTWTDARNVLAATTGYGGEYSHGFNAAARIGTSSTSTTADTDDAGYAPEPESYLLFGSGLLVLGTIFRKKLGLGSTAV